MISDAVFDEALATAFPDLGYIFGATDEFKYEPLEQRLSRLETLLPMQGSPSGGGPEQTREAFVRSLRALVAAEGLQKPFDGVVEGIYATTLAGDQSAGVRPSDIRRETATWQVRDRGQWESNSLLERQFKNRCASIGNLSGIQSSMLPDGYGGRVPLGSAHYRQALLDAYHIEEPVRTINWDCWRQLYEWSHRFKERSRTLAEAYGTDPETPFETYGRLQTETEVTLSVKTVQRLSLTLARSERYPWNWAAIDDDRLIIRDMPPEKREIGTEGEVYFWDILTNDPTFEVLVGPDIRTQSRWTLLNVLAHELAHLAHSWVAVQSGHCDRARRVITPFTLPMAEGYAVAKETEICRATASSIESGSELTTTERRVLDLLAAPIDDQSSLELAVETAFWRCIRAFRGIVDVGVFGLGESTSVILRNVTDVTGIPARVLQEHALPFLDRPGEGLAYAIGPRAVEAAKRQWRENGGAPADFDRAVVSVGFLPYDEFKDLLARLIQEVAKS